MEQLPVAISEFPAQFETENLKISNRRTTKVYQIKFWENHNLRWKFVKSMVLNSDGDVRGV